MKIIHLVGNWNNWLRGRHMAFVERDWLAEAAPSLFPFKAQPCGGASDSQPTSECNVEVVCLFY